MHYNLNERQKPKKHMPWKKVLIIVAVILIAVAVYVLVFRTNGINAPVTPKQA
jgi:flagellar basal body-associated protein FliL